MANVSGANVIAALPILTWRGLDAPDYSLVGCEFQHEQAERRIPYIDGAIHDNTGRMPFQFMARIFFINTTGDGTVFPGFWNQWRDALLDSSAGDLVHPLLGPVRARVLNGKFDVRAEIRSGIIIDVTWVETLDDPAGPQGLVPQKLDVVTLARAADKAMAARGVPYPTGESTSSLFDLINQIKGAIFSAKLSILGAFNKVFGVIESILDIFRTRDDPLDYPAVDALNALYASSLDLRSQLEATVARPTAQATISVDTTLEAFARSVGNTLSEVMGLNLQALRSPIVRRGTTLTYYVGR